MATPQCFQAARVSRCSQEHSSPACGAGWGAGRSGQRPQNPAQPSSDLAPDALLPEAGRGSGWWPPKARPTRSGRGPGARRPHRDGAAHISGTWPPAGFAPRGLEVAAPQGLALLQPIPHRPLPTQRGASPLPTLAPSRWGAHEGPRGLKCRLVWLLLGLPVPAQRGTWGALPRTQPSSCTRWAQGPRALPTLPNTRGVRGGPDLEACQPSNQDPGHKEPGMFTLPMGTEGHPGWGWASTPHHTLPRARSPLKGQRLERVLWRPWAHPCPLHLWCLWGCPGSVGVARLGAARATVSVEFRGAFTGRGFFQRVHNYDTCRLWGDQWPWPVRLSPPPAHLPGKAAAAGSVVAAPSGLQGEEEETPGRLQPRGRQRRRSPGPAWAQPQPSCPEAPPLPSERSVRTPAGQLSAPLPVPSRLHPNTPVDGRWSWSLTSSPVSTAGAAACTTRCSFWGHRGRTAPGRAAAQERADAPGPLCLAFIFQWQLGSAGGGAVGGTGVSPWVPLRRTEGRYLGDSQEGTK